MKLNFFTSKIPEAIYSTVQAILTEMINAGCLDFHIRVKVVDTKSGKLEIEYYKE